tara:strand:- start:357 stop:458 length:102 start_codon:yes stop_codon:yes gene_type:complete
MLYYFLSMIIGIAIGFYYGWKYRGKIDGIGEDF